MQIKQTLDEQRQKKTWTLTLEETQKDHLDRSFNTIELEVYYTLGGINYLSGQTHPRGYYVSITPCNLETNNGWTSRSMMLGAGAKTLLVPTQRKSKKAFLEAIAKVEELAEDMLKEVRDANVSAQSFQDEDVYRTVLTPVMV